MVKVITYGTYDLFHYGHQKLLERAKALGDYLIVGVTADDYDKTRGKINVKQSLMERIENVRLTGLADEIIVEEYEGQKIDDIKKYDIDIFTVGSDWEGKFDYLNEYCKVVYLPRTKGVSSSELRSENVIELGIIGDNTYINKYINEASFVNGLKVKYIYTDKIDNIFEDNKKYLFDGSYEEFLEGVDAVYISSKPERHYEDIRLALNMGKDVLCESPITTSSQDTEKLFKLARDKGSILMESIKTAYSTAYQRLLLLAKSGKIGDIVSIDATCTSLMNEKRLSALSSEWRSIDAWGPTALLPIFQLLGTDYLDKRIITKYLDNESKFDAFTKIDFIFKNATASLKVGKGIKSEGELIISGTKGYFYVPSPWWKTDYFEIRYENGEDNKRFFYQLDGEGIRYMLVSFVKGIENKKNISKISEEVSCKISDIINSYNNENDIFVI